MFKKILLAVDGSDYTNSVLGYGITLAKAFDSRLQVLTVADIRVFEWAATIGADGFVPIAPSGVYQDESRKLLEEKCDKVLQKCAALLSKEKLDHEVEKASGAPADVITERSQLADLLILGKRGEFSRLESKALGATVESVARTIRKPVLVVKKEIIPITNILIGYDGSEHANQALQHAGHLAEATASQMTVLCITDDEELGAHYCAEAEKYLKSYNAAVNSVVQSGYPDKDIIGYATENNYDLIAIGAFGHSRIREAILGSTTEHILRLSNQPVLLSH
jgi:nucleotide-binding universal stress UspA family protein